MTVGETVIVDDEANVDAIEGEAMCERSERVGHCTKSQRKLKARKGSLMTVTMPTPMTAMGNQVSTKMSK